MAKSEFYLKTKKKKQITVLSDDESTEHDRFEYNSYIGVQYRNSFFNYESYRYLRHYLS